MLQRIFYWVISLLLTIPATAQEYYQREADINRFIQDLFPVQSEGVDLEAAYENLYQLYINPLNLNAATRDELAATNLLTEAQLNQFVRYRSEVGPFLSIYELQAIPDFDLLTIRRLLPFISLETGNRSLVGKFNNPTDHYLLFRVERILEEQKGFSPAEPDKNGKLPRRYPGDRQQWFMRYRYSRPRQFSFGLTMEQDPGETFKWQPGRYQYGADYLSFHMQVQNRGRWKNVILGDFQFQAGQGLVFSGGFFLGKGAETVAGVRRSTLGARPYTSLTEYGFLRGALATYALTPYLDLTILAAHNRRDANVVGESELGELTVSSLQTSGLHRTSAEVEDRASMQEQNLGAHLLYHKNNIQVGATLLNTSFDKVIQKRKLAYNEYEFSGKRNLLLGVHGGYIWQNMNFFAEVARSTGSRTHSGGIGAVGGALASLTKRLDATVLMRYYGRNFHSFYGNAFSETSRPINEMGLYTGARYVVYRKLIVGAYVDFYRFPGLRYLVDKPSAGWDYLLKATWTPNKRVTIYGVYRLEHKEKNLPQSKPVNVVETNRSSYVLNSEYRPNRVWMVRTRVQWGGFQYQGQSKSTGVAIAQDATADFGRLSVSGRVAWFSTENWDSRQYVYERDVLSAFSIPAYANRGFRYYLLAQYNVNKHLSVWLRWSRTDYTNQETVGSDLDEIAKPHKSEVKAQIRWRF
ncbi:ComEA family DNA-binding protein [Tellurirhabdus bombi]|uniref:ComEA family DNA-binding protein n=1 Tax=Tellurirhabdus bombi TaxID=2907205 RepID=UPI001F2C59EA|nr:helix-hairpin-helix domain-containing protein [Tellurirhabdus bombi]